VHVLHPSHLTSEVKGLYNKLLATENCVAKLSGQPL